MASIAPNAKAPQDSAVSGPNRRQAERLRVLMPAALTLLDGVFDCALEDISQTGARFIADAPMEEGQQGILHCQPLEMLFRVVWTDGKTAGVQFDEEASLGVIRALRWHNDRFRAQHDAELKELVRDWASGSTR